MAAGAAVYVWEAKSRCCPFPSNAVRARQNSKKLMNAALAVDSALARV
jgi:hypothetical protein